MTERLNNNKYCHQLLKAESVFACNPNAEEELDEQRTHWYPLSTACSQGTWMPTAMPGLGVELLSGWLVFEGGDHLHRTQISYPLLCQWLCSLGGSKLGWESLYTYLGGIFSEAGVC